MPTGIYKRSESELKRLREMMRIIAPDNKGKRISIITEFKKGNTPWNKGKDHPAMKNGRCPSKRPEVRIILREQKMGAKNPMYGKNGEKHHNWKGGRTPLIMKIRNCPQYISWRGDVYKRDEFTCQKCGANGGGDLNAHHRVKLSEIIHENNITIFQEAISCEAIWDRNNGITYCETCHQNEREEI